MQAFAEKAVAVYVSSFMSARRLSRAGCRSGTQVLPAGGIEAARHAHDAFFLYMRSEAKPIDVGSLSPV